MKKHGSTAGLPGRPRDPARTSKIDRLGRAKQESILRP
jgi:hypothetical protein